MWIAAYGWGEMHAQKQRDIYKDLKQRKKTHAIAKAPHILTIQRASLVSRGLVHGKAKARVTARGVETCPNGMAFIQEAQADGICLPGDIFDGKAACSKVDAAHSCLQSVKGNELCVLARFEFSPQDPRAAHGFSSLVFLASTRAAHHSILVLACPTRVALHVAAGAVYSPITIVNSGVQLLDPLHVLVVLLSSVPVGVLVNWAFLRLGLGKEEVFTVIKSR